MADMTLIQAIAFLEGLPKKIGETGKEIMREEFNHKERPYATGKSEKSFHYEIYGDLIFIGSDAEGAKWVQRGRGEVRPVNAQVLHWEAQGKDIFAMRSRKVKPDDFVGRTAKRLEKMDFH